MFILFEIIIFLLVFACWIIPMPVKTRWKIIPTAILAATAFKLTLTRLFESLFPSLEIPYAILLVSSLLFAALLIFFMLLLASKIITLFVFTAITAAGKKFDGMKKKRFSARLECGLAVLALLIASAGIIEARGRIVLERIELETPSVPPEADGLKIVFITDIHADELTDAARVRRITEQANSLAPDLILLGGDLSDGDPARRAVELAPLAELKAKYGVYAVPGNHEYYYGYDEIKTLLGSFGIVMLENSSVAIPEIKTVVGGITDPAAGRFEGLENPNPVKAFAGTDENFLRILISHQMKKARDSARAGADIQLSGHTHGGMIFGLHYLVAAMNGSYVRGLYKVDDMLLYVSRGTGIWNSFPVRICVPPEITLITLNTLS